MRALLCVFSASGNTRRVAEALAERLRRDGHEATLYSVVRGAPMPETAGHDAIVIGYPVHAFNAPAPVLKFLKKLPKGAGMPAYLLRTSGEPLRLNHASGISPKRILRRRGYAVKGEFSYVMPYNIIFRHPDGMASRMWRAAETRLDRDERSLLAGEGECERVGVFRRFAAFVLRIEHAAMPVAGRLFHADRKRCVGCGLCEKACPQGNIRLKDGVPKFGGRCAGCMACAFVCPKDAVRTGIFNGWRVNGAYDFSAPPAADSELCRYCNKAYLDYFHRNES